MKHLRKNYFKKGFTLIELLVVIGILAALLAITLIAINPGRQFSQANNTKRRSEIGQILNAIGQYTVDNRGSLPTAITTTATNVSKTGIDLCAVLVPTYIPALPTDPSLNTAAITDCASSYNTGYQVAKDTAGRVTVSAPSAELGITISVIR